MTPKITFFIWIVSTLGTIPALADSDNKALQGKSQVESQMQGAVKPKGSNKADPVTLPSNSTISQNKSDAITIQEPRKPATIEPAVSDNSRCVALAIERSKIAVPDTLPAPGTLSAIGLIGGAIIAGAIGAAIGSGTGNIAGVIIFGGIGVGIGAIGGPTVLSHLRSDSDAQRENIYQETLQDCKGN